MSQPPGVITAILSRIHTPDSAAWHDLLPVVYEELHQLAQAHMREERVGNLLQPTALVNETYLRLLRQKVVQWKSRSHFFGIAALIMRRILVDEARRRGVAARVLEQTELGPPLPSARAFTLQALDQALDRLSQQDARQAEVVELRYFGGLTIEETADFLGVSPKTVKRDWEVARSWLRGELVGN